MIHEPPIAIDWHKRDLPLTPLAAMVPRNEVEALLKRDLATGLRALCVGDTLIVFGKTDDLPWCHGVRYFGRDALAPTLLLPTHSAPTIPVELFERCIRRRYSFSGPLLIDRQARRVVGLTAERPLTKAALQQFHEGGTL
jgi:hypothetical protein